MTRSVKIIRRELEFEFFGTHYPDWAVLYSQFKEDSKFSWSLHRFDGLSKILDKMQVPEADHAKLTGLGSMEYPAYPVFINPSDVAKVQDEGGFTYQSFDALEAFNPKKWGDIPDPSLQLYGFSNGDYMIFNLDGTYARTSFNLSECWDNFHRKLIKEMVADPANGMRFVGKDHYVHGNGEMFDLVVTFSQEQMMNWKTSPRYLQSALYEVIPFLGLNYKDFERDRTDDC